MSDIVYRQALPEDAEMILTYIKRIGGESDNLTFGSEGLPITAEQEAKHIEGVREDERSVMIIAVKDGEILGDASLSSMPRRMKHRAEFGISVVKDHWNQGIGGILTDMIITYAKEHGIEIINLEVRSDNKSAIHLYEKYGFKKCGESPAFFKIGDEYIDFDLMYLDLR